MLLLTPEGDQITDEAKPVLASIADAQKTLERTHPIVRILSRVTINNFMEFNGEQRAISDQMYSIDVSRFGINLEHQGQDIDPSKLVAVRNQIIVRNGVRETVGDRYTTPETYEAYYAMSVAMSRKIGRPLLIQTGYRSPAYQAVLFARNLVANDFKLDETMHTITPPGYSDHANTDSLATDFMPVTASGAYKLEETAEYTWMLDNAAAFDFYLSYPEENDAHMSFEPWHWVHKK